MGINYTKTTSQGTQTKYRDRDGNWLKLDFHGYEGASEFVACEVLRVCCPYAFATYTPIEEAKRTGCISRPFVTDNEIIVPAWKLITQYDLELSLRKQKRDNSTVERVKSFVEFIETTTGIYGFGAYLTFVFEFDSLIRNEDRHLNNICVLRKPEGYELCPIFDNGLSLLSDTAAYPYSAPPQYLLRKVKAMPFSSSFEKQVKAAEELYGKQLQIDVSKLDFARMRRTIASVYSDPRVLRCVAVLETQLDSHPEYCVSGPKRAGLELNKLSLE